MRKINTSDKRFHNGNGRNEMGTIVTAEWLNAVQDELVNLVTTLGGEVDGNTPNQIALLLLEKLNKKAEIESPDFTGVPTAPTAEKSTSSTQIATTEFVKNQVEDKADKTHKHPISDIEDLQEALDEAGKKGLPVGAVIGFPKEVNHPQGFLLADGTTFSESTYPDLYRTLGNKNKLPNLQRSDVGMTSYFTVDNIPDGWIAFDSIRSVVTQQSYPELYQHLVDKYGSINNVPLVEDRFIRNAGNGLNVGETQGDAIRNIIGVFGPSDGEDGSYTGAFSKVGTFGWGSTLRSARHSVSFDASRVVPTADENRPKSIVLKLCIKAKNSFDDVKFWIKAFGEVENVGVLDAGRLAQDIQQVRAEKAGLNHTHTYNQITDFEQGVLRYINQGFTQNLSETGWTKLPNGLIFQWGKITLNQGGYGRDTDTSLTFPIAFPRAALNVQVSYGVMTDKRITQDPVLSALSTTGMTIRQQSDRDVVVYWRVIGR